MQFTTVSELPILRFLNNFLFFLTRIQFSMQLTLSQLSEFFGWLTAKAKNDVTTMPSVKCALKQLQSCQLYDLLTKFSCFFRITNEEAKT